MISKSVPEDEVIVVPGNVPQVSYFTDRNVIRTNAGFVTPVENFGRATIEFMWKSNASYILLPEDDFFAEQVIPGPFPKTKVQTLDKLLNKIGTYETEYSKLHLYQLPSNITADNVFIVTDYTWPRLSVVSPVNGTSLESRSDVISLNVTGSAEDADSKIKKVEVSMDSAFELAKPILPGDWSHWSYSLDLASEGKKGIVVRATDNADHTTYQVVYVTVDYAG